MDYFQLYAFAADEKVVAAWDSQVAQAAATPGFERALIERCGELFPKFADCYAQLCALPRGARRALQRQLARSQELTAFIPELLDRKVGWGLQQKLARSLAGAALLLALGQGVAQAAVITVTTTNPALNFGDGLCSLSEAIISANYNYAYDPACTAGSPGLDTINLPPGTQKLKTNYGYYAGLPAVNSAITIYGNVGGSTIQGKSPNRIFNVYYNGNLTLNNLTLKKGNVKFGYGGAIYNRGYLSINNCTITGNKAGYGGGAIDNFGGYTYINNSTLSKNSAAFYGGAIYNGSYQTPPGAGAKRNSVVIKNTTITGNKSNGQGGGIYSYGFYYAARVNITSSTLSKNKANGIGGGVRNSYSYTAVNNSVVTGNSGGGSGGGIGNIGITSQLNVNGSTISSNKTKFSGGGIFSLFGATHNVNISTITGNKAKYGGGIATIRAYSYVYNTNIGNNSAKIGGGIFNYLVYGGGVGGNNYYGNKAKVGANVYTFP